jgi:DNA polymerase IV
MDNEPHSSQTLRAGSLSPTSTISLPGLELSSLPPIAVLSAHLKEDEERTLKDTLRHHDAPLTTDVSRAKIFIGKVGTKRRAEFELRSRKFIMEEVLSSKRPTSPITTKDPNHKRRRLSNRSRKPVSADQNGSTTEDEGLNASETEDEALAQQVGPPLSADINAALVFDYPSGQDVVWVIKLDWLEACVTAGHLVALGDNLIYTGRVLHRPKPSNTRSIKAIFAAVSTAQPASQTLLAARPPAGHDIVHRAKADNAGTALKARYQQHQFGNHASRRFDGKSFAPSIQYANQIFASHTAHLLQTTTSEYEGVDSEFPQPPDWVKRHVKYACQRFTPANGPNEDFIDQLKKIRTARTLIDDEIGVRAYSTIIASIAAYPFKLSHPRELAQLPGCDEKTAVLFVEWKNTGKIQAVEDYESDEAMKVLRSFYDIWGVGAKTARNFYYNNHWTELDDIIEFGWNDLDRVQQIGLKYYDEFLVPIPRPEVEQIASIVRQ